MSIKRSGEIPSVNWKSAKPHHAANKMIMNGNDF